MTQIPDLEPLVRRLETELEAAFPGWSVRREESGRWSAVLAGWGALYGQSAPELREHLRRYAQRAADE